MSDGGRGTTSEGYDDLTAEFERLARHPADADRIRTEIVTRALPLAEHIARRFRGRGESYDDLVQVARIGLLNAVNRFDVTRGTDFVSFAVPTIMGEVRHHFRDVGWAMRVPRRLKELHLEIGKAVEVLSQRLGRSPSAGEIAAELGADPHEIAEAMIAGSAYQTVSMDSPIADDVPLVDTIGSDDLALEAAEGYATVEPALARLPERERTIVILRFFGGLTQSQIAERMGISQMHVSRLLAKTLDDLRGDLT
ncbi:SigB/SigF/SigG family RNA polymerase sigma factor [Rhodococcus triatomae]